MTELWTGEFGNAYTARNGRETLHARQTVLRNLLPRHVESVLEVGANVGLNLEAIANFRPNCELYATEPNDLARRELANSGLWAPGTITADFAHKLSFPDGVADLVMTVGVLIHVPTDALLPSMREMHRVARRYILCGEYFAPDEREMPYRGQAGALWLRDYGSLWLDNFPDLTTRSCTFAWKRTTGLDNLTFWLFEKNH